jgi:CRISPR-associated protein Cas2
MMVVVSYDVAKTGNGDRRLRKVAKACENYGQGVQYSVFKCHVEPEKQG